MDGRGGLRGETLFYCSCTKQCLGECELAWPGSCPALSLPGVLAVLWVAHLVRADRQGLAMQLYAGSVALAATNKCQVSVCTQGGILFYCIILRNEYYCLAMPMYIMY